MFMLYLDASGTPDAADPNCSTYVLLGLCLHESVWHEVEDQVARFKEQVAFDGGEIELHAKDFCAQFREQEAIAGFELLSPTERRRAWRAALEQRLALADPGKRRRVEEAIRSQEPFAHLTRAERSRLLADTLDLVGQLPGITLFAEAVDKAESQRSSGPSSAVREAFSTVISRFDTFLSRNSRRSGRRETGLIIADNEPTYRELLERELPSYRRSGPPLGQPLSNVIEQPFFVDSKRVSAVQLADVCAYAVRRHIERVVKQNQHEIQNFQRIFPRFDRDGGTLCGLRHSSRRGVECGCLVCQERECS